MTRAILAGKKIMATHQRCRQWAFSQFSRKIVRKSVASSYLVIGAVATVAYFNECHEQKSKNVQKSSASYRRKYDTDSIFASLSGKTCIATQCEQQPSQNAHRKDESNNYEDHSNNEVYLIDFDEKEDEESRNFQRTLDYYKTIAHVFKSKWDWKSNEAKSSHIPTSSWPFNVPEESEIGSLKFDFLFCDRSLLPSSQREMKDDKYCQNLQFRIAAYFLGQIDEDTQRRGLDFMKELAEDHQNPDAMCSYACCLNDGRAGIKPNPSLATNWWTLASDKYNHVQSMYEIGVAYYTGEGVEEDERKAAGYFAAAAERGHVGAAYMLGDCLLDGVGVRRDRGEALEWLITAAELGHRGARSRVLAVLEKKKGEDFGEFTDSSRQTLKDINDDGDEKIDGDMTNMVKTQVKSELQHKNHPTLLERRYTVKGDPKKSVILARRKTTVHKSRADE